MVQTVGPIDFIYWLKIMTWKKMNVIIFNFIQYRYSNYIFIADRISTLICSIKCDCLVLLYCWYFGFTSHCFGLIIRK